MACLHKLPAGSVGVPAQINAMKLKICAGRLLQMWAAYERRVVLRLTACVVLEMSGGAVRYADQSGATLVCQRALLRRGRCVIALPDLCLLTTDQMRQADQLAIDSGVPGIALMERAGSHVAQAAARLAANHGPSIHVLCGQGNNGGDGFVAARLLREQGYAVEVFMAEGARTKVSGDAAVMVERFTGPLHDGFENACNGADVIIDALFGSGLSRPLDGEIATVVAYANALPTPVVAVDVPSGLNGDTGESAGPVIKAAHTVTFFRLKPGHLLQPGRVLCGQTSVHEIGIPTGVLDDIKPSMWRNEPALWRAAYPTRAQDCHKYDHGHAVIVSGPALATGAARLAARGALRIGSGLVTVASPVDAAEINAAQLTAIMIDSFANQRGLAEILSDRRKSAVLIGPGRGVIPETRDDVQTVLSCGAAVVLDADALTVFAGHRDQLISMIADRPDRAVVLTPHGGEFARLFADLSGSKLDRSRAAAKLTNAIVVLKGADTVIAAPDGRCVINDNAPATLATAGSGDVLAGLVTGLLAQGMAVFEAACAAVWLHGEAAHQFGPGLIAEDLPEQVPGVLRSLMQTA